MMDTKTSLLKVNKVWESRRPDGRLNVVRIGFPFETKGTNLYFYRKNQEAFLSRRQKKGYKAISLSSVKTYSTEAPYINVRQIYGTEYQKYYAILRKENGEYVLRPATQSEKEKYIQVPPTKQKLGTVMQNGAVALGKYRAHLYSKNTVEVEVVIDNGFYCKLRPVDESSLPQQKDWQDKFGIDYLSKLGKVSYQLSQSLLNNKVFVLPSQFMRQSQTNTGDVVPVWADDEGNVVIEGKQGTCSICGKSISHYENKPIFAEACSICDSLLEDLRSEFEQCGDADADTAWKNVKASLNAKIDLGKMIKGDRK